MVSWKLSPRRLVIPVTKYIICSSILQKIFEVAHIFHTLESLGISKVLPEGNFASSYLIYTLSGVTVGGLELHKYRSEWDRRNRLIKSVFGNAFDPKFRKVEYDSGRHHEAFPGKIHPANLRSLTGIVDKGLPYHQKILEGVRAPAEIRKLQKELEKKESLEEEDLKEYLNVLKRNATLLQRQILKRIHFKEMAKKVDKNSNLACIGSPKSTQLSRELMRYSGDAPQPSSNTEGVFRFIYDFDPKEYKNEYIIQILDGKIHITKRYITRDLDSGKMYGGDEKDAKKFSIYEDIFKKILGEDYKDKIKREIKRRFREDTSPDQWYVLKRGYLTITRMPNILSRSPDRLEAVIFGGDHGSPTEATGLLLKNTEFLSKIEKEIDSNFYQLILSVKVEYNENFSYPLEIENIVDYKEYEYEDFIRLLN